MAIDLETLGIHRLTVPERLNLIEQIWDSLPEQVELSELPDWHLAELARRRSGADAAPRAAMPWRDVLAELEEHE